MPTTARSACCPGSTGDDTHVITGSVSPQLLWGQCQKMAQTMGRIRRVSFMVRVRI
eukprot:m.886656 g.886656  ORF g.886656 m.886656 type:complete len:56 (+) comp23627_c0_seq5:3268-3435(+)